METKEIKQVIDNYSVIEEHTKKQCIEFLTQFVRKYGEYCDEDSFSINGNVLSDESIYIKDVNVPEWNEYTNEERVICEELDNLILTNLDKLIVITDQGSYTIDELSLREIIELVDCVLFFIKLVEI